MLVGIVLTLLLLIGTPLVLTAFFKTQSLIEDSNIVSIITCAIYICAIPYVYALVLLKKLCEFVANKNPFSHKSTSYFKKDSYVCI